MDLEENVRAAQSAIGDIVSGSSIELFSAYGCDASLVQDRPSELCGAPTALIDSGSNELEIHLAIKAPFSVLAMSYPVPGENLDQISDTDLEDWLSELANQLIGRIKQSLVKRGHFIDIGLPESFYGDEWHSFDKGFGEENVYVLSVDGQDCEIHVCTEIFDKNLVLEDEASSTEEVQCAGEIDLF